MMAKYPFLKAEDCDRIVETLRGMKWEPGVSPSDSYADTVKCNLEIPMGSGNEAADAMMNGIIAVFMGCKFLLNRTIPKHIGRPRFTMGRDGGEYRRHADSAFMGENPEIRTDLSVTLFLTDPDTYEGGELVLEYPSGGVVSLKEPKGTMVFYPSGVMHHVRPVTSGERICFIAWIESHIQDPQKRDILVDITNVCTEMEGVDNLSSIHIKMTNIKHNLFRQWMKKA
jgi:PKHD-type hydroxylase